ncbi:MAG TPA: choice-of-anchor D domain-containing protein, partial [Planctomycetaceae bacterium]|nr:choice-of-anchor D domain-containing protein [Planctomycetaceae bacterium]
GPNSLIYLTFLGGSGKQSGGQIAVDGSGDVAITGTTTSVDFPVTDATQPTNGLTSGDGNDVIVSEIDPTGTKLMFSTIFGGSGAESLNGTGGIALDSSGDVYIASDTTSTDLDVTSSAYQTMWDGQTSDGFLAIFSPPAQAGGAATLKYCSYLGTNAVGAPGVGGIAVDSSGNAYIAGFAANTVSGFPVKNAFQTAYGGGTADAFLMKISPLGAGSQDLVYATELGGSGEDEALAVAVDSANPPNAYVTGLTQSSNFPTNGSVAGYQSVLHVNATSNAFLSVISQNAGSGMTALAYSTYLGGSSSDAAQGVSVGASNAVYVAGSATSYDFPWKDNLQPFNGAGDAFVAKIDPTSSAAASLIYATPLGGTSPPGGSAGASANAVATDGAGHAYVAGVTTSGNFPTAVTTSGSISGFQPNCSSCTAISPASDAFIGEIAEAAGQSPSVTFTLAHVNFPVEPPAPQFVGIVNAGEAALTISSISLIGANAGDFQLSGQEACIGVAIVSGAPVQCSFEVAFTPSAAGPETAEVVVTDNAPGSPQVLELSGVGMSGPLAVVSPASVNFGNQPENTTSANPAVVYVQNVGGQPLTLSNFAMGGADPAQFPISAGGPTPCQGKNFSLPPEGTCTVQVSFAPSGQGPFQAELDFFDNSGGAASAEQAVELTGTGVATAPIASVTPQSWSFGSLTVGASGAAQTFQLANKGSAALSISSIGLTGTNAADFSIASTGTTCPLSSGSLPIGGTCNVAVKFVPQTAGSKNASLTFADNASGSPQQIALSGAATSPPVISVSNSSLSFKTSVGISTSQSIQVSNAGNVIAGIGTLSITPSLSAPIFNVTSNSCTVLAVGGNPCQITVSFLPTAPGSYSATLTIPVSGGDSASVALSGTATQASISVPTTVKFADQLAGTAGTAVPVVVTNNSGAGGGALSISSVSISESGNTTGDFSVTADSCTGPATPPGGTCSIQVAFQPASQCPTITSQRNATLTINDNAPGSPHTVPLSGTALDFCVTIQPGQNPPQPISPGGTVPPFNMEIQSSDTTAGSAQLACSVPAAMLGGCTIATTPTSNPPVVQITSTNPGLFAMTVTSTAPGTASGAERRIRGAPPGEGMPAVWWMSMALLAWCVLQRLARRPNANVRPVWSFVPPALAGGVLLGAMLCMAACGGGSSGTAAT